MMTQETDPKVRFKGVPGADAVRLSTNEKAVDYNADLLKEKYGNARGEKMYQDSIDSNRFGGNPSAGPFLMHNKIQQEKKVMMAALGKKGHPDSHHYQALYQKYMAKQMVAFRAKDTREADNRRSDAGGGS